MVYNREDLYAGIIYYNTSHYSKPLRKIFYVKSNDKASDIIYDLPAYDVNNVETDLVDSYKDSDKFIVLYSLSLNNILTYFGYDEKLSKDDIRDIYKKFISNDEFILKNYKLFGGEYNKKIIDDKVIQMSYDEFIRLREIAQTNNKPQLEERKYIRKKIKKRI